jgi:oligoribonuclease
MTGLEPETDVILEIATIITDKDLNIIEEGPNLAIKHSHKLIEGMDEWNQKHHGASGLIHRVRESETDTAEAEQKTLAFIQKYTRKGFNPLCGNTIGQDRRFLYKYMTELSGWLSYRSVDVTSIKELAKRWYPMFPEFAKEEKHQALDDIRESIAELRYYRKELFVDKTSGAGV